MAQPGKSAAENRKAFQNWSQMEPEKGAAKLWEFCRKHEAEPSWRHDMAARGARAYAVCGHGNLFENLQFENPLTDRGKAERAAKRWTSYDENEEYHARAMVETVIEKLFGMDQPKSQLVATDAPYEVRRQGVWADRFTEGTFHLRQGSYLDLWDMARQGALLAYCSTGTAAIRTEPDYVERRVRNQLRSTLNTFIDPADMAGDRPLSYFDVTWEHPDYLCADERFKGKEDKIWKAAHVPRHLQNSSFGTPRVKVFTAWRSPLGKKGAHGYMEGREAILVAGDAQGEDWIWWDKWERSGPPLAFLRCNRAIGDSFWGENLIEIALGPLRDARRIDQKAKLTMDRTSQTYIAMDGGTTSSKSALLNAKDVVAFTYDSKKGEKAPEIVKPGILNGDYFDWQARKIALAHELIGVSLMHQAGEVQGAAGHRSGRSIRLEASMLPERFARKLRGFRDWIAVDIATNHIEAAKQIGKVDPDWTVTWPGADFEATVKVDVLDIELNQYTLRPYAVSEQKNTPAERADAAQDLYDRGEINDSQLTMILEGLYDTKYETKASTAERAYVAKTIDQMLYGDEKLIANENQYMQNEYMPPVPWMDPQLMLAAAAPKYTQAMIDKVPQNRRTLLRRFMEDIWALRQQQLRDEKLQEASLSVSATTTDPFAAAGAMPNAAALSAPATPGAAPAAPGFPPAPAGPPLPAAPAAAAPINAPGAPGMV